MGRHCVGCRHLQPHGKERCQAERDGKAGDAGRPPEPVEDLAQDGAADEAAVKEGLPVIRTCLSEFERILGDSQWFGGAAVSLGDLHVAPVFAYMTMTPESADLLKPRPRLAAWWQRVSARDSMAKTQPKFG